MTARPVLGIDLGTTYTCVAHLDSFGKASPLPNADGENTTPSVVYFEEGGGVVVGKDAKNELRMHPGRVIQLIKRQMGAADYFVELDGRRLYPAQISGKILESVVRDALVALGVDANPEGPVADVVVTVPAYFGDAERAATREAGKIADLNVVSIINEPTAAAVAYGLAGGADARNVLVYDLGGGTFDVTVVEVSAHLIRAIATGGNRELGGADWDAVLRTLVLTQFREQHPKGSDPSADEEAMGALDVLVEDIKKSLTKKKSYSGSFTADTQRASVEITREQFEEATADLVERTLNYTELVLDAAKAKGVTKLDEVICVGGMSRVPVIATALGERLNELLTDAPMPRIVDPDQIVAKGAALFAAAAVGEDYDSRTAPRPRSSNGGDFLPSPAVPRLINITSRGYGIKAVEDEKDEIGHVSWLIMPNDELPTAPTRTFRTVSAGQTSVEIVVYESTTNVLNDDISVNTELIRGDLEGLPGGQPPGQPLEVAFSLGDEGLLEIIATGPSGQHLRLEYRRPGAVPVDELVKPLPKLVTY